MAVLVWVMVVIALWHFTVVVPDRFWGGIIGAFMVAVVGGLLGGYLPSIRSPVGQAILGRRPGDVVDVDAPGGTHRVEILEIDPPPDALAA